MSNAYTYFSSSICIGRFFLTSALLFFILQQNKFVSFRCQESRCSDKAIGGRNLFDSLDGYWLSWSIQLCFCLSSRELRDTVGIAMDHDVLLQILAYLWLCTRLLPRCTSMLFVSMLWDCVSEMQLFVYQMMYEYGEPRWNDTDRVKPKDS
jgi:hypothetical protein